MEEGAILSRPIRPQCVRAKANEISDQVAAAKAIVPNSILVVRSTPGVATAGILNLTRVHPSNNGTVFQNSFRTLPVVYCTVVAHDAASHSRSLFQELSVLRILCYGTAPGLRFSTTERVLGVYFSKHFALLL